VEAATRDDVEFLKISPLLPKDVKVAGFVLDLETGKAKQVA
jgi:hypothetical protein